MDLSDLISYDNYVIQRYLADYTSVITSNLEIADLRDEFLEQECRIEDYRCNGIHDEAEESNIENDVVLISDDETDIGNNSLSLKSWQLKILIETWEAWPVLTDSILSHLIADTRLDKSVIQEWFKSKTDQELLKCWNQLK